MRYRLFGRSGLRVSEFCLGTMTFGNDHGSIGASVVESRAIFDAFVEAGGNFIDTAHLYAYGTTSGEQLVGDFISADRDHFVVSTKYALSIGTDIAKAGASRKNMMRSIDQSLQRLRTEYVDVYWLHMWDDSTPLEEVMRGFEDLVRSGKVNYIAISDTPAWQVSRATMLAELRGWSRFCGKQVE
jgi:aryl-alcohol dehydrogenase-like predicted oxidoreductase